jgi:hypothetical protein
MKYERFEDLPVWQLAAKLASEMFDWTRQSDFRGVGDLANQLQRASLSISTTQEDRQGKCGACYA